MELVDISAHLSIAIYIHSCDLRNETKEYLSYEIAQSVEDEPNLVGAIGVDENLLKLIPIDETFGDLRIYVNFVDGAPKVGSSWEIGEEVVSLHSNVQVYT